MSLSILINQRDSLVDRFNGPRAAKLIEYFMLPVFRIFYSLGTYYSFFPRVRLYGILFSTYPAETLAFSLTKVALSMLIEGILICLHFKGHGPLTYEQMNCFQDFSITHPSNYLKICSMTSLEVYEKRSHCINKGKTVDVALTFSAPNLLESTKI